MIRMSANTEVSGDGDADRVKATHARLRRQCQSQSLDDRCSGEKNKEEDAMVVWQRHLLDEQALGDYARSMHSLATGKWTERKNNETGVPDRIEWVVRHVDRYFRKGDAGRIRRRIRIKAGCADAVEKEEEEQQQLADTDRIKMLDVGSCFNPFSEYGELDVTAIDIAPAIQVHKSINAKCSFSFSTS